MPSIASYRFSSLPPIVRLVAQRHLADGPQYEVHQGRSLRSGLAQSLEDQHSSVDLVITVDHASRAPVCGVGLGRLAGVLGESVWPQPFARLAGSIQRTSLSFIYNALGHVRRFVRRVWHDRNASKSSKVELDRIFPILEPAFFHDFGRSARFAGETGVKNCAESVLTEARRVASASVDRLMPTSPGTPGRS